MSSTMTQAEQAKDFVEGMAEFWVKAGKNETELHFAMLEYATAKIERQAGD